MTGNEFQSFWISELNERYDSREAKELLRLWLEDRHEITRLQWSDSLGKEFELEFRRDLDRLKRGEPLQYVVGQAFFDDLKLKVNASVLIPRPETEDLVRLIAKEARHNSSVLDIGTGSGAIALALKERRPDLKVSAIDISEGALRVARENALRCKLDIHLEKLDVLQTWPDGEFDMVVSNPPYIEELEAGSMADHVIHHEPHLALFVPNGDPLLFYRSIADQCMEHGIHSVWFECHIEHVQEVEGLLKEKGFSSVKKWKDITGRDRFVSGNSSPSLK